MNITLNMLIIYHHWQPPALGTPQCWWCRTRSWRSPVAWLTGSSHRFLNPSIATVYYDLATEVMIVDNWAGGIKPTDDDKTHLVTSMMCANDDFAPSGMEWFLPSTRDFLFHRSDNVSVKLFMYCLHWRYLNNIFATVRDTMDSHVDQPPLSKAHNQAPTLFLPFEKWHRPDLFCVVLTAKGHLSDLWKDSKAFRKVNRLCTTLF